MTKYQHFLSIAQRLNAMAITPLLFGSLGLERRLGQALNADDIDILIPEAWLLDGWHQVLDAMESLGYELCDVHEHAFQKGTIHAAFASLESLTPFAEVDITDIPVIQEKNIKYLLLSLWDYRKVYLASARDGYRRNVKNKKDMEKVALIDGMLFRG